MSRMSRMIVILIPLTLVVATGYCSAADLYIMLHPKALLEVDKVRAKYERADARDQFTNNVFMAMFYPKPKVLKGDDVTDIPFTGESFVLEFLPSKFHNTKVKTIRGTLPGDKIRKEFRYEETPYDLTCKLWHVKALNVKPQLLAETVEQGLASQLKHSGSDEFEILKLKPDELARDHVFVTYENLGKTLHLAVADKIIGTARHAKLTPTEANFLANSLNVTLGGGQLQCVGERAKQRYRVSKVVVHPKGDATVEVNLHNRLPIKISGELRMRILPALPQAMPGIETWQQQKYTLDADEKKTLTFAISAELTKQYKLADAVSIELLSAVLDSTRRQ